MLSVDLEEDCVLEYHTAQGVNGGSCTTGSYQLYPLTRSEGSCSFLTADFTNDVFTPTQGKYQIKGFGSLQRTSGSKIRLVDSSDSSDVKELGSPVNQDTSGSGSLDRSWLIGFFEANGSEGLQFEYIAASNPGTVCLGGSTNIGGEEIYGKFSIKKVR